MASDSAGRRLRRRRARLFVHLLDLAFLTSPARGAPSCRCPSTLGVQPRSSCLARAPATVTNSNLFQTLVRSDHSAVNLRTPRSGSTVGAITRSRARSASTIDRSRSTHASSSSFTITYSYSATARDFAARGRQPLAIASSESLLRPRRRCSSDLERGRQHEDADALAQCDPDLARALDVDDEHEVAAGRPARARRLGRRCRRDCRRRRPTRGRRLRRSSPRSARG